MNFSLRDTKNLHLYCPYFCELCFQLSASSAFYNFAGQKNEEICIRYFFQQREEADWTLLLTKDKISVPGARKAIFKQKKTQKSLFFMMIPGNFSAQICRRRCMVSFGVDFVKFCNLDSLVLPFYHSRSLSKSNREKSLQSQKIATHVETDEIILLMELN